MKKSKGVLIYARNNSKVDYIKQACFLAERAKDILDLPTSIVTDSPDYLKKQYPNHVSLFDHIIPIVWNQDDVREDTVLSRGERHGLRNFYDGSLVTTKLEWKNEARPTAYDASPYDETLLLDTDIVINNDIWKQCFTQKHDFLIYKESTELIDIDREEIFARISDSSVDFYWATAIFFRKTAENKVFFDLVKHVQENWYHYCAVFQLNTPYYRNDYAFSIAIHIMNGYQSGNFAKNMPGKLYFTSDKSILWEIDDRSLLFLLEKPKYVGEYTLLRTKDVNVHCINKFSLNRCIDEQ
jgi:hypothetical protein